MVLLDYILDKLQEVLLQLVVLQTGKIFEEKDRYEENMTTAPLSEICSYLKLFHARSKLIIILYHTLISAVISLIPNIEKSLRLPSIATILIIAVKIPAKIEVTITSFIAI